VGYFLALVGLALVAPALIGVPSQVLVAMVTGACLASVTRDVLSLLKEPPVAGYANRTITIPFPELAEEGDQVWVAILNPRQQPPDKLRPREIPTDENGRPLDDDQAVVAMYEIIAGLLVAWRVYDATAAAVDPDTGAPLDQPQLPKISHSTPATVDLVRRLPMQIITRISEELKAAANPQ
jgi:hypothetical protein